MTKRTKLLIWIAAWIAFVVVQRAVPGPIGIWLAVALVVGVYYALHGIRVSWTEGLIRVVAMLGLAYGLTYVFDHASAAVNDTSILVMAMIFGACFAYNRIKWWERRHHRPLP